MTSHFGTLPMGFAEAYRQAIGKGALLTRDALSISKLVLKSKVIARRTVGGRVLHPTKGYYGAKKHGNRSNRT